MIAIFDWDGTLCDSLDQIVAAMQAAARELDEPVPSAATVRNVVGLGLAEAIHRVFPSLPDSLSEPMAESYGRHFIASDQAPATLFPGARDTLDTLRDRGFELAIATGKSRRGLDRVLANLTMDRYFDSTRCADETRSKPDPLMIEEILMERGMAADQAVVIGDTEYDLAMAAAAGVASVGVSFGVHSPPRLREHGPVTVVDSLPELLNLSVFTAH